MVCYLNIPYEVSKELISNRQLKFGDTKDIEESNEELEKHARETGLYVANKLNWKVVDCTRGGELKSKEEIHQEIVNFVLNNLNKPERKKRKQNSNKKIKI